MGALIAKSFVPEISDEQMKNTLGNTSFISFGRAIEESLAYNRSDRTMSDIKGYKITNQGIEILWK